MLVEMTDENLVDPLFGNVLRGDVSIRGIFKVSNYQDVENDISKIRLVGRLMKPYMDGDQKMTRFIKLGVNVRTNAKLKLKFEDIIDDMQLALQKEVYYQLRDKTKEETADFDGECLGQIIVQYYEPNGQIPKLIQKVLPIMSTVVDKEAKLAHYILSPIDTGDDSVIMEKDIDLAGKSAVADE